MKVKANTYLIVRTEGTPREAQPGEVFDVPADLAAHLLSLGAVTPVQSERAVKQTGQKAVKH